MLVGFVILYLLVSISIGLYVSTKVHNTKDFAVAGRHLPLPVVTATVFATWFGAEAIFGISATFAEEGLRGIVADPFGSSMCLIIAGIFFATYIYKLNVITLGDFFRLRYNRTVEVLASLCIVASYLGWVSAQIMAMGLLFNVVTQGAVSTEMGMVLGAVIVLTYTTVGGMMSVAILDFVQMSVIIGGLLYIGYLVTGMTGGVQPVIDHADAAGKLDFFPSGNAAEWLAFIAAWLTMMLGSLPQQDVYQRIASARSAKIALWGSIIGASIYFCFTFVPTFIAYSATLINPEVYGQILSDDSQLLLPTLIMQEMPLVAQIIFFGAVLSAIMSCSAATLLAPSVAFSENVIKPFMPHLSDKQLLRIMRFTIVGFACVVLVIALNSNSSIFEMVENAYKVTLAGAFVPLVVGALWKRATKEGALAALILGLLSWIMVEILLGEASLIPPQLVGLGMSLIGMIAGSLLTKPHHHVMHHDHPHHQSHATHGHGEHKHPKRKPT